MADMLPIEVAFATPEHQALIALEVPAGCTVCRAVELSNIAAQFPGVDLANCPVGLFGHVLSEPQLHVLEAGDRIELYRPLLADPKEVRRLRAAKAAAAKKAG